MSRNRPPREWQTETMLNRVFIDALRTYFGFAPLYRERERTEAERFARDEIRCPAYGHVDERGMQRVSHGRT